MQPKYYPDREPLSYVGQFLSPQGNLNFSVTGIPFIRFSLDTTGSSFNNFAMMMRTFDSGKFFIKTITDLYYTFQFVSDNKRY